MAQGAIPAAGKDVARPGMTPPDATSKPVIVGHTSEVTDPMMNPAKVEPTPAAPATSAVPAAALANPLATPIPSPLTAPPATSTGSSRPKLIPSSEAIEAAAKEEAKVPDTAETKQAADLKVEEERTSRLQEIIETGEYNVSIGKGQAKGSVRTFLGTVIGIVLVGVIALYILTDLKVIDLGVKLPFHIFKQ